MGPGFHHEGKYKVNPSKVAPGIRPTALGDTPMAAVLTPR